jgi:CheY-like chemotaxis protein
MPNIYKTCLLVDDNYIDNFVTRSILESGNFADEVIVKQSAAEALTLLKEGAIKPDVIFLDIRMPVMTGFEFLDEYAQIDINNKEDIKIYMLSSSLDPADYKKSSGNRFITQFVNKPITHKTLEEINK